MFLTPGAALKPTERMNMSEYKEIPGPIEGYKIFNNDMTCLGFQFRVGMNELGNDDPLVLCENGFHFCKYPSGVWTYYDSGRVFKVRAYGVLNSPIEPGADYKMVCRKLEILDEVIPTGDWNTGDSNTGNWNTGYRNTGDWNTGDRNTGDSNNGNRNTGDSNTGDRNTGNRNTGHSNTGNSNTGNRNTGNSNTGNWNTGDSNTGDSNTGNRNTGGWNTGNRNTGNSNTGDWNTGNRNTGDSNTGGWNCGNRHSGYFCIGDAPIVFFGNKVRDESNIDWGLADRLGDALALDDPFDPTPYLSLPNATKEYIKRLHEAHIEARNKASL